MYHVTARGVARRPIYRTDDDRWEFLRALSDTVAERTWRCHAYCLMDNHYHLLVDTPNADLPEGMRDLNSAYATRFNGRHATTGHVFQGRYDARLVRSDAHALEVARYIPLNPVRAGLCIMPESWRWSSYRAMTRLIRAPTFLDVTTTIGWFGHDESALPRFCEFVDAGRLVTDPEEAALTRLVASGRLEDALRAHVEYGYSLRAIASQLGIHHSKLARRLAAPKGV